MKRSTFLISFQSIIKDYDFDLLFHHKFCSLACIKVHGLDVHIFGATLVYGSNTGCVARQRRKIFVKFFKKIIDLTSFDVICF
jgi:hypothetical protein